MKKIDKCIILKRFEEKHGKKYDYSKVEYTGYHGKVIIICNNHGEFSQTPAKHISGQACRVCNTTYSIDTLKRKLKEVHKDKYEFIFNDNVVDTRSKIEIKCKHGIKEIQIRFLLQGQGCIYCKGKKWDENDLRDRLSQIHTNLIYKDGFMDGKYLNVVCKYHGDFRIRKDRHLGGQICPKCSNRKRYDQDFFIESISLKFDSLTYGKCKFESFKKKVTVTCKKHGDFKSYPHYLLNGNGCKLCAIEKSSHSKEEFLHRCMENHPEIDHSIMEYKGVNSKIKLICKEHGVFEQKAGYYLNNSKGCKYCRETKGEKKIRLFLEKNNICYKQQYLKFGFYFDFFLPNLNVYLEFNGKQHYEPIGFFGGLKTFERQIARDIEKDEIIHTENLKLIKIGYWQMSKIDDILEKELIK